MRALEEMTVNRQLSIDLTIYNDEQALLEGLRRGDPDACTCFFKRFAAMVYARALHLLRDADEADTVLQTTFIKACEALPTYTGAGSLRSWLYRIVSNEGLMLLRQKRPQVSLDAAGELPAEEREQANGTVIDPALHVVADELRREIEQAIASLPEPLRAVLVLREIEQLSTEETAQRLGITPGAAKVRLHRARALLRQRLGEDGQSEAAG